MQKHLLFLMMLLVSALAVAAPVTPEEAQQRARDFLTQRKPHNARRLLRQAKSALALKPVSAQSYYYVFNVGEADGFVIVSGDDRTEPILGYTDAGSFDEQTLPDNMKAWLQGYADELRWMEQHPDIAQADASFQKAPRKTFAKSTILPLLTSEWNQDEPYNNSCPDFFSNGKCVTGCVATAMAQVMYYHQWPAATTKQIDAYDCSTNFSNMGRVHVEAVPANTTLDWSHMTPTYSSSSTDEQKAAVATLMAACGASVGMDYRNARNGGSSASAYYVAGALKDYFDYSATTTYVDRDNYLLEEWTELIYGELEASRPVLYGGQSSGGGHAFVLDGYDGEGKFHVNWGWGGSCNGYFLISVLNPKSSSGIGASSSSDGYSSGQEAIIGIKKNEGEAAAETAPMKGQLNSVSDNTVYFSAWNNTGATNNFDIGVGYFKNDGTLEYIGGWEDIGLAYSQGYPSLNYSISGLADGSYTVVPICRLHGTEKWFSYVSRLTYVQCEIVGGNVTLTLVTPTAPSVAVKDFILPNSPTAGMSMSLTANVENTGGEYYGKLYLFASTNTNKGAYVASTGCTVPNGQTVPVEFFLTLSSTGTYNIWVATDENGSDVIGQTTMTLSGASGTTDNVNLTYTRVITPLSGSTILDTTVSVSWTITNPSDDNYQGNFTFFLWTWTGGHGDAQGPVHTISVPAHQSVTWTEVYSDLDTSTQYSFTAEYVKNGTRTNNNQDVYTLYTVTPAVSYYLADGTRSFVEPTATLNLPSEATAVDLRGNSVVTAVTGGNPNTLFVLDAQASAPTGITTNIIRDGVAQQLVITDGYDFAPPFDFTAAEVTYDRTFTTGYVSGGSGWTTITLPFNVTDVQVTFAGNDYPIDWFRSANDTDKNFWVMQFDHEDAGTVYFSHADNLVAARPYIIAVPGQEWGADADLTGLPLHFRAANVQISASLRAASMGSAFKMKGTFVEENVMGVYVLNNEGNRFQKNNAAVEPFRAYFAPTTSTAGSTAAYRVRIDDTATAIRAIRPADAQGASHDNAWYTLEGVRIAQPAHRGIYIHHGRKVVIQ